MLDKLEVVLKTSERCNINCTYCYFFNAGDDSYLKHDPHIKINTIKGIADFLKKGQQDLSFKYLQIDFHGGEPLLQRKSTFDKMCEIFREAVGNLTNLTFALQTNAILIDDEWIELFHKHNIHVGVSLDGPKVFNDKYRIDFKGNGTYDKVVKGLKKLTDAADRQLIESPALLCVINPAFPARKIYRHFVDDLGILSMDFLLPDLSHDSIQQHEMTTGFSAQHYGDYLCELFTEWMNDNDSSIRIRLLNSIVSMLVGGKSRLFDFGPDESNYKAMTISSSGDLCPDDILRSADPAIMQTNSNVYNTSLKTFLSLPLLKQLELEKNVLSKTCQGCHWKNICGGGLMVHRYKKLNRFDNPSVMCDALINIYECVTGFLLNHNFPQQKIEEVLFA